MCVFVRHKDITRMEFVNYIRVNNANILILHPIVCRNAVSETYKIQTTELSLCMSKLKVSALYKESVRTAL